MSDASDPAFWEKFWGGIVAAGAGLGLLARKVAARKPKPGVPDYASMVAENTAHREAHREALRAEMRQNNDAMIRALHELGDVMRDELSQTRREIIDVNEHGRERFLEVVALLNNSMTAANTKLDFIVSRTNGR